jgi:SpoVK/Ycf46/Vps4 family AAA+-type ATPase
MIIPITSVHMTYSCSKIATNSASLGDTELVELQNHPLLQSCLKRQLVGCQISGVENDPLSPPTRLQITMDDQRIWSFVVDSIVLSDTTLHHHNNNNNNNNHSPLHLQQQTRNSHWEDQSKFTTNIGIILPSTRITFVPFPSQHHPVLPLLDTTTTATTAPTAIINDHVSSSPAARILMDTLHCIHRIQSSAGVAGQASIGGCDIPRAFLLSGPPGVGKTHAVRMAVQGANQELGCNYCHLVVVQGSEIRSDGRDSNSNPATTLEHYFLQAIQQMRVTQHVTMIFLDECDALLASSRESLSSPSYSMTESILGRLLDEMNSLALLDPVWMRLIVVAATNRVDAIPTTLRRPGRLDREIPLTPPDADTRMKILQSLLTTTFLRTTQSWDNTTQSDRSIQNGRGGLSSKELQEIADSCVGFVPADLAAVVRRVELLQVPVWNDPRQRVTSTDDGTNMTRTAMEIWAQAVSEVGASALRDAALTSPPTTTWDDIAGDPGGAKTILRQAIEWPRTKRAAYQRLGLTAPRGILLHGPPGCAKTMLARAAAGASGVSFLSLSPAEVYSTSFVGDAEAVIRRAFTLARSAAPCVLFFDEMDAILGTDDNQQHSHGMGRGSSGNVIEARVLSTFLNEMDGIDGSWKDGVLVLGATNRPRTLDTALLRPGRLDKIIYVPPPDYEGRRALLNMHCQHWRYNVPGTTAAAAPAAVINVDYLASDAVSGNMTGAELVGACRTAAMLCLQAAKGAAAAQPSSSSETNIPEQQPTQQMLMMKEEYIVSALKNVRLLSNSAIMDEFQSFRKQRCHETK